MYKLYSLKPENTEHVKGIWIHGESGVGKSRGARKALEDAKLAFYSKK